MHRLFLQTGKQANKTANMSFLKIIKSLPIEPVVRRIAHLRLNPDSTIEASSGISPILHTIETNKFTRGI